MKLTVLGSGSRGNCIALQSGGQTLLVDAGFGARAVVKRLDLCGLMPGTVVGVVLTHEHGDHTRGVTSVARKFGCPVYGSRGTLGAVSAALAGITTRELDVLQPVTAGTFTIDCCATTHDAAEPVALAVALPDGRKVGIACDIGRPTAGIKYLLRGSSCLVIESNYDDVMLRSGPYPPSVQQRIAGSAGHLSNRTAGALAAELSHPHLEHVVLVHLSERCNTTEAAADIVGAALKRRGFRGRILVAGQDEPTGPIELHGADSQLELEAM